VKTQGAAPTPAKSNIGIARLINTDMRKSYDTIALKSKEEKNRIIYNSRL
jgi:hypothetical protein